MKNARRQNRNEKQKLANWVHNSTHLQDERMPWKAMERRKVWENEKEGGERMKGELTVRRARRCRSC